MPTTDLLIILKVYLVSLALQFLGFPIAKRLLGRLPDEGYAAGRMVTTLLSSLIVWEFSHLGVPINNDLGLLAATGFVLAIDLLLIAKYGLGLLTVSKNSLKIIVLEEYLFFIGLCGISIVRGFLPNIDTLEKFMDFGFVNSYLNSQNLPAPDMWQAGKAINYYSFGHFWASELIRYFMISPTVGYNIVLGYIAGQSLTLSFAISHYLSGARKGIAALMAGLAGALGTVLAGNTHVIWYILKNKGLDGYWYAEATRFIHNTIHEFPSYSFVVADLHGHLLDLPVVLLFIFLFCHWVVSRDLWSEVVMGVLFGVMMMTNTWDVAVYGLVMCVSGLFILLGDIKNFVKLLRSAGVILVFMSLTALPWFIGFQSISSGIMTVTDRSPLWQLFVLWSGGLLVAVLSIVFNNKNEQKVAINTIAISLLVLILIPELFYAKDIYPDHPRANTMFKLTYQSSIMIGLLTGVVFGKLFNVKNKFNWLLRSFAVTFMVILFCGTLMFPAEAFPTFYGNFEKYHGLDGESWLKTKKPERYGVVEFLRIHKNGRNIVEAVGDSYTEFNAVSVYSGVPTIQGWRVHEWLWRGGYDTVSIRETDVRSIYESIDRDLVSKLLEKYNVGWVVVGEDERATYQVNESLLLSLGEVSAFGETYLVKLR